YAESQREKKGPAIKKALYSREVHVNKALMFASLLYDGCWEFSCGPLNPVAGERISFTRPTEQLVSRTLIPWGWLSERVRSSWTMPRVSRPERWSCLRTILTSCPGRTSDRLVPSMVCLICEHAANPRQRRRRDHLVTLSLLRW